MPTRVASWVRRNTVALLALFVALGGTAYAASKIDGGSIEKGTITAKKLKKNTLGGKQINEAKLGTVPRATDSVSADTAKSAGTALNSETLDGLDSAAFTRSACGSQTGALQGFARVDANAGFSSTFTTGGVASAYNCSGGTVEARRTGAGQYEVRFNGASGLLSLVSSQDIDTDPDQIVVSTVRIPGTEAAFEVEVSDLTATQVDIPFVIALP